MNKCSGCRDKLTIIDRLIEKGRRVISSCAQCISLRQDLTRAREALTESRRLLAVERHDAEMDIDTLKRTVGEAVSEIDRLTMVIDKLRKGEGRIDAADIEEQTKRGRE